jgi:hypothetical protein
MEKNITEFTPTTVIIIGFDEIEAAQMLSIHRATLRTIFTLRSKQDFIRLFNAHVVRSFVDAQRLLARVNFELETSSRDAQHAAATLRAAEYGTAALDLDTNPCQSEDGDPLPGFDTVTAEGHTLTRFLRLTLTRERCLSAIADLEPLYCHLARPDLARPDLARPDLARPDEATGADAGNFEDAFDAWVSASPLLESAFAVLAGQGTERDLWELFEHWQQLDNKQDLYLEQQVQMFLDETEKAFSWRALGMTFDDCIHGMLQTMPSL